MKTFPVTPRRPRRPGLSLPEHHAHGEQLKVMRSTLFATAAAVQTAYPKSHPARRQLRAAVKRLDRLRCQLDDAVSAENPTLPHATVVSIYYGPTNHPPAKAPADDHNRRTCIASPLSPLSQL